MKNVLIGHIDSGVDQSLPIFKGAVKAYRCFDYHGKHDIKADLLDTNGHGTMTASLMLGRATGEWAGGIAQEAEMLVAVAIESGHRISRVISALMWMVEEPVRIVNLSIGFSGWNPIFQPLIQTLVKKGVLVVAAIGNGGAGQYHSPGAYPEVLSVGTANREGKVVAISGSMNNDLTCIKPDLLGLSSVPSIGLDGNVRCVDTGTSGATAIVSGIVAQLMSQFPHATIGQIVGALKETSLSLHPDQKHRSVKGLIQPEKAAALLETNAVMEVAIDLGILGFFRDPALLQQMQYSSPDSFFSVYLYFENGIEKEDFINASVHKFGAIQSISVFVKYDYVFVTATVKQIEIWWRDNTVLMISRVY